MDKQKLEHVDDLVNQLGDELEGADAISSFRVLLTLLERTAQPRSVANMLCGYKNGRETLL